METPECLRVTVTQHLWEDEDPDCLEQVVKAQAELAEVQVQMKQRQKETWLPNMQRNSEGPGISGLH